MPLSFLKDSTRSRPSRKKDEKIDEERRPSSFSFLPTSKSSSAMSTKPVSKLSSKSSQSYRTRDQTERNRDRDRDRDRDCSNRDRYPIDQKSRNPPQKPYSISTPSQSSSSLPYQKQDPSMQRNYSVPDARPRPAYPTLDPKFSRDHIYNRPATANSNPQTKAFQYTPGPTIVNKNNQKAPSTRVSGNPPPSPPPSIPSISRPKSTTGARPSYQQRGRATSYDDRSSTAKRESTRSRSRPCVKEESEADMYEVASNLSELSEIRSEVLRKSRSKSTLVNHNSKEQIPIHRPQTSASRPQTTPPRRPLPQTPTDPSPKTSNSAQYFPQPFNTKSYPVLSRSQSQSLPQSQPQPQPQTQPKPPPFYPVNLNPSTHLPPSTAVPPPHPPPPPPPPGLSTYSTSADAPGVDYLLPNGGLDYMTSRKFFQTDQDRQSEALKVFSSFHTLLNNYAQVIHRNGSIAVSTGYRSVARRLLDRLEKVFNRNISSENCTCIICSTNMPGSYLYDAESTGVSWGEILEYVSGRKNLPSWPPFTINSESLNPDLSIPAAAPFQKLDEDVPEEFREHYIRQSQKTKKIVSAWLQSQPSFPSSPPQEVDDDTLYFAILTHLPLEKRKIFVALVRPYNNINTSARATPVDKSSSELISRTTQALHRLYRLSHPPRDHESALFLLKHPEFHTVLATIAAISCQEWDILISGRFDGFLWSGAELEAMNATSPTSLPSAPNTAPGRSTNNTPFDYSQSPRNVPSTSPTWNRGQGTPAFGAPVQVDEDAEIVALAEVERDIYIGMEALEDAFEILHCKAEQVRSALLARSGALAAAVSQRGGPTPGIIMGTPSLRNVTTPMSRPISMNASGMYEWEDNWDKLSEIAPDDSASNISFGAGGRRKRRDRMHTPMRVDEEDE